MPRKTAVTEVQKEDVVTSSPLRRSSRLSSASASSPAPAPLARVLARRNSATETATTPKTTRARRASVNPDAQLLAELEPLKKVSKAAPSTPSRRGRKPSTNASSIVEEVSTEVESPKKVVETKATPSRRGRKPSVEKAKPESEPKPATRTTRKSLAAAAATATPEPKISATRRKSTSTKQIDEDEEVLPKSRENTKINAIKETEHVDTPVKKTISIELDGKLEVIEETEVKSDGDVKVGSDNNEVDEELVNDKVAKTIESKQEIINDESNKQTMVQIETVPRPAKTNDNMLENLVNEKVTKVVESKQEIIDEESNKQTKIQIETMLKPAETNENKLKNIVVNDKVAKTIESKQEIVNEESKKLTNIQIETAPKPAETNELENLTSDESEVFTKPKEVTLNKSTENSIEKTVEKVMKSPIKRHPSADSFADVSFNLQLSESILNSTKGSQDFTENVEEDEPMEVDVSLIVAKMDTDPPKAPFEEIEKKLEVTTKVYNEITEFLEKEVENKNVQEKTEKANESQNDSLAMDSFSLDDSEILRKDDQLEEKLDQEINTLTSDEGKKRKSLELVESPTKKVKLDENIKNSDDATENIDVNQSSVEEKDSKRKGLELDVSSSKKVKLDETIKNCVDATAEVDVNTESSALTTSKESSVENASQIKSTNLEPATADVTILAQVTETKNDSIISDVDNSVQEESSDDSSESDDEYQKFIESNVKDQTIDYDENLDITFEPTLSEVEDVDIPEEDDVIVEHDIICVNKSELDSSIIAKRTRSIKKHIEHPATKDQKNSDESKSISDVKALINQAEEIIIKSNEENEEVKVSHAEEKTEIKSIVSEVAVEADKLTSTNSTAYVDEKCKDNEGEEKEDENDENEEASSDDEEYKKFAEKTIKGIEIPESEELDDTYKPDESGIEDENEVDEDVIEDIIDELEVSKVELGEDLDDLIKTRSSVKKLLEKKASPEHVSELVKESSLIEEKNNENNEVTKKTEICKKVKVAKSTEEVDKNEESANELDKDDTASSEADNSDDEEEYKKFIEKSVILSEDLKDSDMEDASYQPSESLIENIEDDDMSDEEEINPELEVSLNNGADSESVNIKTRRTNQLKTEIVNVKTNELNTSLKKPLLAVDNVTEDAQIEENKTLNKNTNDSLNKETDLEKENQITEIDSTQIKDSGAGVSCTKPKVSENQCETNKNKETLQPVTLKRVVQLTETSVINLVTSESDNVSCSDQLNESYKESLLDTPSDKVVKLPTKKLNGDAKEPAVTIDKMRTEIEHNTLDKDLSKNLSKERLENASHIIETDSSQIEDSDVDVSFTKPKVLRKRRQTKSNEETPQPVATKRVVQLTEMSVINLVTSDSENASCSKTPKESNEKTVLESDENELNKTCDTSSLIASTEQDQSVNSDKFLKSMDESTDDEGDLKKLLEKTIDTTDDNLDETYEQPSSQNESYIDECEEKYADKLDSAGKSDEKLPTECLKGSKRRKLYHSACYDVEKALFPGTSSSENIQSSEDDNGGTILKEAAKNENKNDKEEKENVQELGNVLEENKPAVVSNAKGEKLKKPLVPSLKPAKKASAWEIEEAPIIKPSTRNITPIKPEK